MITRNFTQYIIRFMHNIHTGSYYTTISGDNINSTTNSSYELSLTLHNTVNGRGHVTLRIGTGTAEPSYDDWKLEQMLEVDPKSIVMAADNTYDNSYCIVTATFLNETDTDWIITEVGECLSISSSASVLIAREVFDPVTVKPGQTFSVSMKLF